ncbi:AraC family transcriptional regulator [Paenibacillus hodogayensis]|uniref:AraC family transcriptional regulator n=1 Tax=Paenibacillus hodogayensis TaxID=279208 RepID=A0ABV5W3H1_9BACL
MNRPYKTSVYRIIEQTVAYIEENMKTPISLDDLSASLNVSKFHLHRLIRHTTGQPLVAYIRARKLSRSVDYLLNTDWNIIDIATEFGFEHEQSYIRSFKRLFGATPSYLRKVFAPITLTEKMDLSKLENVAEGLVFEPTVVVKPVTYLVGKKGEVHMEENYYKHTANAAGNRFFYNDHPKIPNKVNENLYIGLTQFIKNSVTSDYIPSAEVHSLEGQFESWDTTVLPAHKYMVFKYVGDFHPRQLTFVQLEHIWNYIDGWLPHSIYEQSAPYYFEYIDVGLASEDYCEVDLYIPIQNKQKLLP